MTGKKKVTSESQSRKTIRSRKKATPISGRKSTHSASRAYSSLRREKPKQKIAIPRNGFTVIPTAIRDFFSRIFTASPKIKVPKIKTKKLSSYMKSGMYKKYDSRDTKNIVAIGVAVIILLALLRMCSGPSLKQIEQRISAGRETPHVLIMKGDKLVKRAVRYAQRGKSGPANAYYNQGLRSYDNARGMTERPRRKEKILKKMIRGGLKRAGRRDEYSPKRVRDIRDQEKVVANTPNDPLSRVALGDQYTDTGLYEQAIEQYKAAKMSDPENIEARKGLIRAYALNNDPENAQREADELRALAQRLKDEGKARVIYNYLQDNPGSRYNSNKNESGDSIDNHLELARIYEQDGMLEDALKEYQRALAIDPKNTEARNGRQRVKQKIDNLNKTKKPENISEDSKQKARAAIEQGRRALQEERWGDAERAFKKARKQDPTNPDAHSGLAHSYLEQGKDDAAQQSAREALRIDPNNPEGNFVMGKLLEKQGLTDKAIDAMKNAVAGDPDNSQYHYMLGLLYYKKGRATGLSVWYRKAVEQFIQVSKTYKKYNKSRWAIALCHEGTGENEKAIQAYMTVLSLDPAYPNVHYNMGYNYFKRGRYKEAISQFQAEIGVNPVNLAAYNSLGESYLQQGKTDDAIDAFMQSLSQNRANENAYYGLGKAFEKKGMRDKAIEAYENTLKINPNHATSLYNLGALYEAEGNENKAINYYKQCINADSRYAKAHHNLGRIYMNEKNWDQALPYLKKAVDIDPESAIAQNSLGRAYEEKQIYDEAIERYKSAIRIDPVYTEAHFNLGNAFYAKQWYEEAEKEYLKVLNLNEQHASAHERLGYIYLKELNNKSKARYHLQQALNIQPDNPNASKIQEALDSIK